MNSDLFGAGWEAVAAARLKPCETEIVHRAALHEWLPRGSKTLCVGTGIPQWLVSCAASWQECLVCVDAFEYLAGLEALKLATTCAPMRVVPSLEGIRDRLPGTFDGALVLGRLPWMASDQDRVSLMTSVRRMIRPGGSVFLEVVSRACEADVDFRLVESNRLAGLRVSRWSRVSSLGERAFEVAELVRVSVADGVDHESQVQRVCRVDALGDLDSLFESSGFARPRLLASSGASFGFTRAESSVLVAEAV